MTAQIRRFSRLTRLAGVSPLLLALVLLGSETAGPANAQPSSVLDLAAVSPAHGIAHWVYGSTGEGLFGIPVAGGHDVDGDGLPDYAVAHMTADPLGRTDAGEIDLVFGDGSISGFVDTASADPRMLRIYGAGIAETAGSEIWIDDVTGDGLADVLICRQNHTPGAGRIGAGALTILVGGPSLRTHAESFETIDLAAPPAELQLTTLIGATELDRLGIWVRTGDVDGDGVADIALGADQEDGPGAENRGAVYVIRGGAHLATAGTVDLASFGTTVLAGHLAKIIPPPGSGDYHLGATCQVADLDGNGRAEVLAAAALTRVGASLEADGAPPGSAEFAGGAPDGTVYIAWDDNFPAGLWPAGFTFDITASPGGRTILNGEHNNGRFGEELLAGMDFDHDGTADLFVGELTADGTLLQNRPFSGVGYVFYRAADLAGQNIDLDLPPPGLPMTRILGPSIGAIGGDTAAQGDFDGDGIADLAYGSPHADPEDREDAGTVHVFFGQTGGWPALIDTVPSALPGPEVVRITEIQGAHGTDGSDLGDTLCYSAAAADLDGDGRDDLIVNEMIGNGLELDAIDTGNLLVISGGAIAGGQVFSDGFESGDFDSWSSSAR